MKRSVFICMVMSASLLSGTNAAIAGNAYVSGNLGSSIASDSDNSGTFPSGFTTGEGTTIPAGTALPAGSAVGWKTEFDTGYFVAGAAGWQFDNNIRIELELSYLSNDVDTHSGVSVAGIAIDSEDAGVLITGSPNLGVSVGDLVASGQGDIESLALMANAFYDLKFADSPLHAYVGGGIGFADVDVKYSPSSVGIVDDGETVFAYQAMIGAGYTFSERVTGYAGYRYRATEDIETNVSLFPATLEIENTSSIIEVGFRLTF